MTAHDQFAEDLVLYAMGSLREPEVSAVRQHLESCRECQRELRQIESDLANIALSAEPLRPPARSKDRLMRTLAADRRTAPKRQIGWSWAWGPALAAVFFAVLAMVGISDSVRLRNELEKTKAALSQRNQNLADAQTLIDMMKAKDSQRATLVAMNSRPQPQCKTIYNPKMGKLLLVANDVEPAPPGKAYQLWLLPKSGSKPVKAGMFWPDKKGSAMEMMHMPNGVDAKAFAITVEDASGSETPTMPIVMMGETGT